jgi:hypothetical protein
MMESFGIITNAESDIYIRSTDKFMKRLSDNHIYKHIKYYNIKLSVVFCNQDLRWFMSRHIGSCSLDILWSPVE